MMLVLLEMMLLFGLDPVLGDFNATLTSWHNGRSFLEAFFDLAGATKRCYSDLDCKCSGSNATVFFAGGSVT